MRRLAPKYIMRYQKGHIHPDFHSKGAHQVGSMGRHLEIYILGQDEILEAGEDLLTPTGIPSQITTNSEEVDKESVGYELTREDMAKLWPTEDLLVWYEKELLVWHHRLNNFSFK